MKIVISSGKGGVGKTFVATSLARVVSQRRKVTFLDCDVETPNAWLFLQPQNTTSKPMFLPAPTGANENCDGCGLCAKACHYNALGALKNGLMVFPELCHWCGACLLACPKNAIEVAPREIGEIFSGVSDGIDLHWATLKTAAGGFSPRLIAELKTKPAADVTIIDSAPGTGCGSVEALKDATLAVLVGDATPFGIHDLTLSIELCRDMSLHPVIVINRSPLGDVGALRKTAASHGVEIIAEIPDDRRVAELYSDGLLAVEHIPEIKVLFEQLAQNVLDLANSPKTVLETRDEPPPAPANETPAASMSNNAEYFKPRPEVVVVSGKGGVGKTSLSACFAQMSAGGVADCDVDAADLHLLLSPRVTQSGDFVGGRYMEIDLEKCVGCGRCAEVCKFGAIDSSSEKPAIRLRDCEGCGACAIVCPCGAITSHPMVNGRWYLSETRVGGMSHAKLIPGQENSGKLVSVVRRHANEMIAAKPDTLSMLDGPPGTGCPVIASVGGAKFAVMVTEPTVSGVHDLKRIFSLAKHFGVPAGIIINKADINPSKAREIKLFAEENSLEILGELDYDTVFVDAQQTGKTLLEFAPTCELSKNIRTTWDKISKRIS